MIDASVAAKWYLRDEDLVDQADWFRAQYQAHSILASAPYLSRYEVGRSLTLASRLGRLNPSDARQELANYCALGLHMTSDPDWLIQSAAQISLTRRVGYYDSVYLALADSLGIQFVTADNKLINALAGALPFVHWLGDL